MNTEHIKKLYRSIDVYYEALKKACKNIDSDEFNNEPQYYIGLADSEIPKPDSWVAGLATCEDCAYTWAVAVETQNGKPPRWLECPVCHALRGLLAIDRPQQERILDGEMP